MTDKRFSHEGFNTVAQMLEDFERTVKRACRGGNWGVADSAVEAAYHMADAWRHTGDEGAWMRHCADRMHAHMKEQREQA